MILQRHLHPVFFLPVPPGVSTRHCRSHMNSSICESKLRQLIWCIVNSEDKNNFHSSAKKNPAYGKEASIPHEIVFCSVCKENLVTEVHHTNTMSVYKQSMWTVQVGNFFNIEKFRKSNTQGRDNIGLENQKHTYIFFLDSTFHLGWKDTNKPPLGEKTLNFVGFHPMCCGLG